MPAKKIDPVPVTNSNVNTNNNTNNVNVNVKLERPRTRKSAPAKKSKTSWLTRAIVGGAIAIAVSLLGYYFKKASQGNGKPARVESTYQLKNNRI